MIVGTRAGTTLSGLVALGGICSKSVLWECEGDAELESARGAGFAGERPELPASVLVLAGPRRRLLYSAQCLAVNWRSAKADPLQVERFRVCVRRVSARAWTGP